MVGRNRVPNKTVFTGMGGMGVNVKLYIHIFLKIDFGSVLSNDTNVIN